MSRKHTFIYLLRKIIQSYNLQWNRTEMFSLQDDIGGNGIKLLQCSKIYYKKAIWIRHMILNSMTFALWEKSMAMIVLQLSLIMKYFCGLTGWCIIRLINVK